MKHDLPESTLRKRDRDEQNRPPPSHAGHQHDPVQHHAARSLDRNDFCTRSQPRFRSSR
jgi:hypothetical protein